MAHQPRTQWPKHPQPDHANVAQIDVDLQEGLCELHIGFGSAGLGYPEVVALINQLEVVRDLLEPPAPVGRTYAPKLGEH